MRLETYNFPDYAREYYGGDVQAYWFSKIDVDDAKTPREAAESALTTIRCPDSQAVVFSVIDDKGEVHDIDLLEDKE